MSAYVERLVADAQRRAELEELSAHTASYYDSLSAKEAEELSAWGELGEWNWPSADPRLIGDCGLRFSRWLDLACCW